MACFSGTNIVNDGLVFHFDLENGVKSWKGKPTSNLAVGKFFSGNGNFTINENITDTMPDGSIGTARLLNAQTVVDPNRTVRIGSYSLTAGETYTLSFYVMNIDCTGFGGNLFSPTLGRVIGRISYPAVSTTKWTRVVTTFTVPNEGPNPVTLRPQAFRDGGIGRFKMSFLQMEQGSIATKYIDGIRLDTASIIDISPTRRTITAANLTYRQNDTPTFDGTDDYLRTGTPDLRNSSYSISAWIKPYIINRFNPIVGDLQFDWFGLYFNSSNQLIARHRRVSGEDNQVSYVMSSTLTANTWYYVNMAFDIISGMRLYVNGSLVASNSNIWEFMLAPPRGPQYIGRHTRGAQGTSDHFAGEISQVKIYNRVLTPQEIQQNFEATRSRYGI